MRNNTAVIIPSYNAGRSIKNTINGVLRYLPKTKIIVVDDNSPDGTVNLINKEFKNNKKVQLIIRKNKGGRGSAILRGFSEGLRNKNLEYFVEMDADLCHNPKYIPLLIKKCRNCDVAIASKYLKGSKIQGLSMKRRLFSKIVNHYIRLALRVPITDYTNGFRCYRREILEKINFNSFRSKGFVMLSEIVYMIHKKGGSFDEIPFDFNFNKTNKSNFNLKEINEAFLTILRLKFDLNNFKFWQRKNEVPART